MTETARMTRHGFALNGIRLVGYILGSLFLRPRKTFICSHRPTLASSLHYRYCHDEVQLWSLPHAFPDLGLCRYGKLMTGLGVPSSGSLVLPRVSHLAVDNVSHFNVNDSRMLLLHAICKKK
jgi:hypothetical protein